MSEKDKTELTHAFSKLVNFKSVSKLPIQAIQLLIHLKLNSSKELNFKTLKPLTRGTITRFVSKSDGSYLEQVRFIMNLSGIAVKTINDKNYCSTSDIIKNAITKDPKNPWQYLRKRKKILQKIH